MACGYDLGLVRWISLAKKSATSGLRISSATLALTAPYITYLGGGGGGGLRRGVGGVGCKVEAGGEFAGRATECMQLLKDTAHPATRMFFCIAGWCRCCWQFGLCVPPRACMYPSLTCCWPYLSGFLRGLCRPVLGHDCRLCTKWSSSDSCVSGSCTKGSPFRGSGMVFVCELGVHLPATAIA